MQLLLFSGAALAVALLYLSWHALRHARRRRQRLIRERVALLLWRVAHEGASSAA